jgi:hypothetical protein
MTSGAPMPIGFARYRLSVRSGLSASTGAGGRLAVIPWPGETSGLVPVAPRILEEGRELAQRTIEKCFYFLKKTLAYDAC